MMKLLVIILLSGFMIGCRAPSGDNHAKAIHLSIKQILDSSTHVFRGEITAGRPGSVGSMRIDEVLKGKWSDDSIQFGVNSETKQGNVIAAFSVEGHTGPPACWPDTPKHQRRIKKLLKKE